MVRLEEENAACTNPGSYEDSDFVRRILAPLTEAERFLLTAREVDGMSYEELAEVFGLSEGALRTRIARLKSDIRERVERLDREPVVGV
jgi:RNA polymerase sigma factor (sigma-70 family)